MLPPLLDELAHVVCPTPGVTLLCATGTHRQASGVEMEELIGPSLWLATGWWTTTRGSDDHVPVGEVDGVPMTPREYVEADLRIITGFVEPHFFAGFSGGPKAVCPGLAATETILEAHHPRRIADARATFLIRRRQSGARLRAVRGLARLRRSCPSTSRSTGLAGSQRSLPGR